MGSLFLFEPLLLFRTFIPSWKSYLMTNCLNCHNNIVKEASFCPNCGAKVITERITLKRILSEVAETIFGWDNKYFYTLKSLIIRPHLVLEDYVKGVRKRYVHPFTYLIIGATLVLFTFTFFLDNFMEHLNEFNIKLAENYKNIDVKNLDLQGTDKIQGEILKYFNIVTLLLIPLYSLFTFIIYRKTFNYAEHLVFNAYIQGTGFIVALIFFYISLITHPLVYSITTFITLFLHAYIFGKLYRLSIGMSILKLLLFNVMFIAFIIILVTLIVLVSILIAYLNS